MTTGTVKDNRGPASGNTPYNAIDFMVRNILHKQVHTADVVIVTGVEAGGAGEAGGWVTVRPLVAQVDAYDRAVPPVELFRLPYCRVQGGIAALVIDPAPGDIGIAVYMKRDSTKVGREQRDTVQPGSFRTFDQGDGYYVGGFLNRAPEIFLELDQDHNATLTAPRSVTVNTDVCTINADSDVRINCRTFTVNASASAAVNAPSWGFHGADGTGSGTGVMHADIVHTGQYDQIGDLIQRGDIVSSGDHMAGGVSLTGHTHSGVESGGGTSGPPRN